MISSGSCRENKSRGFPLLWIKPFLRFCVHSIEDRPHRKPAGWIREDVLLGHREREQALRTPRRLGIETAERSRERREGSLQTGVLQLQYLELGSDLDQLIVHPGISPRASRFRNSK